jgi:hypothetical protein
LKKGKELQNEKCNFVPRADSNSRGRTVGRSAITVRAPSEGTPEEPIPHLDSTFLLLFLKPQPGDFLGWINHWGSQPNFSQNCLVILRRRGYYEGGANP